MEDFLLLLIVTNYSFLCAAYPAPLTSVRGRKPLFGEIGHTIMNLLVVSNWTIVLFLNTVSLNFYLVYFT